MSIKTKRKNCNNTSSLFSKVSGISNQNEKLTSNTTLPKFVSPPSKVKLISKPVFIDDDDNDFMKDENALCETSDNSLTSVDITKHDTNIMKHAATRQNSKHTKAIINIQGMKNSTCDEVPPYKFTPNRAGSISDSLLQATEVSERSSDSSPAVPSPPLMAKNDMKRIVEEAGKQLRALKHKAVLSAAKNDSFQSAVQAQSSVSGSDLPTYSISVCKIQERPIQRTPLSLPKSLCEPSPGVTFTQALSLIDDICYEDFDSPVANKSEGLFSTVSNKSMFNKVNNKPTVFSSTLKDTRGASCLSQSNAALSSKPRDGHYIEHVECGLLDQIQNASYKTKEISAGNSCLFSSSINNIVCDTPAKIITNTSTNNIACNVSSNQFACNTTTSNIVGINDQLKIDKLQADNAHAVNFNLGFEFDFEDDEFDEMAIIPPSPPHPKSSLMVTSKSKSSLSSSLTRDLSMKSDKHNLLESNVTTNGVGCIPKSVSEPLMLASKKDTSNSSASKTSHFNLFEDDDDLFDETFPETFENLDELEQQMDEVKNESHVITGSSLLSKRPITSLPQPVIQSNSTAITNPRWQVKHSSELNAHLADTFSTHNSTVSTCSGVNINNRVDNSTVLASSNLSPVISKLERVASCASNVCVTTVSYETQLTPARSLVSTSSFAVVCKQNDCSTSRTSMHLLSSLNKLNTSTTVVSASDFLPLESPSLLSGIKTKLQSVSLMAAQTTNNMKFPIGLNSSVVSNASRNLFQNVSSNLFQNIPDENDFAFQKNVLSPKCSDPTINPNNSSLG